MRKDEAGAGSTVELDRSVEDEEVPEKQKRLVCVRCHHPITDGDARIEVSGRHEHRRSNPHGYHFRFGCFSRAPGCLEQGQESSHFSWFPGRAWQVTTCGLCHAHLGWRFFGDDGGFFGLILDKLREAPEEP